MHHYHCGPQCPNFTDYREGFPAGSCTINGVILKLSSERKDWIRIVGCATLADIATSSLEMRI